MTIGKSKYNVSFHSNPIQSTPIIQFNTISSIQNHEAFWSSWILDKHEVAQEFIQMCTDDEKIPLQIKHFLPSFLP